MCGGVGRWLDPRVGAPWMCNIQDFVLSSSSLDTATMSGQRRKKKKTPTPGRIWGKKVAGRDCVLCQGHPLGQPQLLICSFQIQKWNYKLPRAVTKLCCNQERLSAPSSLLLVMEIRFRGSCYLVVGGPLKGKQKLVCVFRKQKKHFSIK